ncbi:MAG: hypothetical protein LBD85_01535 [Oscillospiraceae bacterium]|jgi:hypothetical protein|nr:hypothetical protein [Oscillospiraceae bacterium]
MKRLNALAVSLVVSFVLCCLAFSVKLMLQPGQVVLSVYVSVAMIVIAAASAFVGGSIAARVYELPDSIGAAMSYRPRPLISVVAVVFAAASVWYAYDLFRVAETHDISTIFRAALAALSAIGFAAVLIFAGKRTEWLMRLCFLLIVVYCCYDAIIQFLANAPNPDKDSYAWMLIGQAISTLAFLNLMSVSVSRKFTTIRIVWIYLRVGALLTAIAIAVALHGDMVVTTPIKLMIIKVMMLWLTERLFISNLAKRVYIPEPDANSSFDLSADIPLPSEPEQTLAEEPEPQGTATVDDILREIENDTY